MTYNTFQQTSKTRGAGRRRGIASVLAMLYLVLFSALAVGFYTATTMSSQISRNERHIIEAQVTTESGMQFIRYYLGAMDLPSNTNSTNLMANVRAELARMLDGRPNMQGETVQIVDGAIQIPSATKFINLDMAGNRRFRVIITQSGPFLYVDVLGGTRDFLVARAVELKYTQAPRASAIFDYGVASRGKIVTSGSSVIIGLGDPARGSILSTNMTDAVPVVIGGKEVSGDISVVNPNAGVQYGGAKIGGTTNTALIEQDHIHRGVNAPDFPDIDVTDYAKYAVNKYTTGKILTNAYIEPGTNPSFSGGTEITGVLLIKAPNRISFSGNTTIRGVIVVENGASFDPAANSLSFGGNVTSYGVDTLPDSFGDLRKLTGAFMLAPNFAVSFTGSFGTVNGSIIASQISFSGNAGGIIKGSVINLNDTKTSIGGTSDIVIASTGTSNYPAGVSFGKKYTPLPDTYKEIPVHAVARGFNK